ncbi:hypothetical protein AB1Y20_021641 [Prymnesium parvum]|uniref:Uncharacterized protein n=1 Tax=Prymnesium parvum TaxID=97485 RepID=A0AB34JKR6_PRYPA
MALFSGWFHKKATSSSLFGGTKRRFVVLTPGAIRWFKTEDTTGAAQGELDLRGGVSIDQPGPTRLKISGAARSLQLECKDMDGQATVAKLRDLIERQVANGFASPSAAPAPTKTPGGLQTPLEDAPLFQPAEERGGGATATAAPRPPAGERHSIASSQTLGALSGYQAQVNLMQATLDKGASRVDQAASAGEGAPRGLRNELSQLHGSANKLLATQVDAVTTGDLHSGKDEARAVRKLLVVQLEKLIEDIEVQIKRVDALDPITPQ